jgi:hypothetical protein
MKTAAIEYARRGFSVFPCYEIGADGRCTCGKSDCHSPGKHPRTNNGVKDATADPTRVEDYWDEHPKANIAIAMGRVSDSFALDIDPRNGGRESLTALVAKHGDLPPTVEADTGGGGLHFYFVLPSGGVKSRSGILPGIDIKSDSGYVIASPSNHVSGRRYSWRPGRSPEEITRSQAPQWLLDLLLQCPAPGAPSSNSASAARTSRDKLIQRARSYAARASGESEGGRNSAAFRLAGHIAKIDEHGDRLGEADILGIVRSWNAWNSPPLDDGELRSCVHSAMTNGTPRSDKPATSPAVCRPRRDGDESIACEKRRWQVPGGARAISDAAAEVADLLRPKLTHFSRGGTVVRRVEDVNGRAVLKPVLPANFASDVEKVARPFRVK